MSGIGTQPRSLVQPHQEVTLNYDYKVLWNAVDSAGLSTMTNAYQDQISPGDIHAYSLQQYQTMTNMFNYYQYYRCKKYSVEYVPRYSTHQAPLGYITNQIYSSSPALDTVYTVAAENLFMENAEISLIFDKDDTFVRANDLQEYYLVRSLPGTVTAKTTNCCRLVFDPTQFDMTMNQFNGTEDQRPTYSLPVQATSNNATTNNNSGLVGATTMETTIPEVNRWRATKIATNVATNNTTALNLNEVMFGFKYYFYTPFNSTTATPAGTTVAIYAGLFRIQATYEFKDMEFRAFVVPPALAATEEEEKKLNLLRKVKGESYVLQKHRTNPTFTPIRQAQRAVAENAGHKLAGPDGETTIQDDYVEVVKKAKTGDPSPTPASQGTPGPPKARFPLGLGGSR